MRVRAIARVVLAVLMLAPVAARAQEESALDAGLTPGSYLRIAGGMLTPVHPSGSLRDWNRGSEGSIDWENWVGGEHGGPGTAGFGLFFDYGVLPLNENQFIGDYEVSEGTHAQSATANRTSVWDAGASLRFRIPAPLVMPSILVQFGIVSYSPGTITYTAPDGSTGTARQKGRSGAQFSIGGGLDRQLFDRYAIFAEALYEYGYTNIGGGLAVPGAGCQANGCDALKNTTLGTVRGGLRVRIGR